ncbi:MAG: beta-mannosidase [Flavobacteriaceae bacterium]|nr:beta-mannosidase [Flavobacteriaceae bacterium]
MRKYNTLMMGLAVLLTACQSKQQNTLVLKLHENWTVSSAHGMQSYPATVPGNIFSDLMDNEIIEDPFVGENEYKVQWVSDSIWVYKSTFNLPKSVLNKQYITLNFDGLDTYATVKLNGKSLIKTNNAFRNYTIPIKGLIKSENAIDIRFNPTSIHENNAKAKLDVTMPEGNRIFTRKAQFQYGWDWGPVLNTSGIWKDIYVKAWNMAALDHIYLEEIAYTAEEASFNVNVTLTNPAVVGSSIEVEVAGKVYVIELNEKQTVYSVPVNIENPTFWWPHNLGTPHLYKVDIRLTKNGELLDAKELKHGIRTVELVTEPDAMGEPFYFKINGSPVYMKGANYIPQHSMQNRVTTQNYKTLLGDVVAANMNMLRVWGGGIYEDNLFYELCDEKGILVWQDFMYACAMYPGDEAFLENAKQEAVDQLMRLRNHPSIVLWCGNNESSEGWHRWGWQDGKTEKQKDKIWSDYLKLFDSILPRQVANYSKLPYWESSPKFGRGNPKFKYEGDAHDWWVWHDGYPFEHFENHVPRFMSEYGFQSFPSEQVLDYIMQDKQLDLSNGSIKSHQKHHRGFQLIKEYMKRDFPVPTDPKDYVYVSQLVQAKGIRIGIEAHRRAKPYNMGTLYWQLNDCWPVISWSSIDYFGQWKALHYATKEAFENVLISFEQADDMMQVYVVNDNLEAVDETLYLTIQDFKGNVIWETKKAIAISANSSKVIYRLPMKEFELDPTNSFLQATLGTATNLYYFERPKDLKLEQSKIDMLVTKQGDGFAILLKSATLQKYVQLSASSMGVFDNNYFDLLPNHEKQLYFSTKDRDVTFQIRSLNLLP